MTIDNKKEIQLKKMTNNKERKKKERKHYELIIIKEFG